MPEDITIRMIDASAFADYEIAFFVAGLFGSFASGFFVAAVSAPADKDQYLFFGLCGLFVLLMLGAISQMRRKRGTMLGAQKSIPFKRSDG